MGIMGIMGIMGVFLKLFKFPNLILCYFLNNAISLM